MFKVNNNVNGNDLAILILGSNYIRSHRSKDIKQTSFHEKTKAKASQTLDDKSSKLMKLPFS